MKYTKRRLIGFSVQGSAPRRALRGGQRGGEAWLPRRVGPRGAAVERDAA
jgi:hypothetical protein